MLRRRADLYGPIILATLLCCVSCHNVAPSVENKTGLNESRPRVFSPRMDYDEWTPLGRGDPLKNDPTFDYVPPVLDRVQYWLDSHTTEPSTKRDILVLGVTAKKTSPKIPEQFLKFVDGPKFNRNQEQYRNEPVLHRSDFTGSTGAEPPKVIRTTNFRNSIIDYRNQNRIQSIPTSYYPSPYYNQKPKPYTMMLPPPMIPKPVDVSQPTYNPQKDKVTFSEQNQQFSTQTEEGPIQTEHQIYNHPPQNTYSQPHPPPRSTQPFSKSSPSKNVVSQVETIKSIYTSPAQNMKQKFESTTPSVSFEKSNLIYHSTQTISGISGGWLANNGQSSELNQVTWQTPVNGHDHLDAGDHHAAASSSHEVVIGQNANIIVDGESNENEEVVIGQKEVAPPDGAFASGNVVQSSIMSSDDGNPGDIVIGQPTGSKMHIVMANTGSLDSGVGSPTSKEPVSVVMPANYMEKLNVTIGDLKNSEKTAVTDNANTNRTRQENANTMTSEIEQIIQISNPLPPQNTVTNSPFRHDELVQPFRMMPQMNMHHAPIHSGYNAPNAQPLVQQPQNMANHVMHMNPSHVMMPHMPNVHPNMGPNVGNRHPMGQNMGNRNTAGMGHVPPQMVHMQQNHMASGPSYITGPHMNMEQGHQQHKMPQPPPSKTQMMFTSPPVYPHPTTVQNTHHAAPQDQTFHVKHVSNGQMNMPLLPTLQSPVPKPETVTQQTVTPNLEAVTDYIRSHSPLASILNKEASKASPPPPTTTVPSLTTDPIFSHYKQPAKPIRGPMYLIIQGHSKVKTYKPTVNKYGVPVENNEIQENMTEHLSKLEQLINENTRSRNVEKNMKIIQDKPREKKFEQDSLLRLVESNLSGFTVPPPSATEEEQQANSVTTIEINN